MATLTLQPVASRGRTPGVPTSLSRFARRRPGATKRLTGAHARLIRLTGGRLELWRRFSAVSPVDYYEQSTARRVDVVALTPTLTTLSVPARGVWRQLVVVPSLVHRPSAS